MTQRDQLQEQYEHALFALMMNEAIQKQGQQALDDNEQLKKSNDFTISPKTDKKIKRLISRKLRFHPVGMKGMSIPKMLKRAAFASCAVVFLTGTAFAVSPTFKNSVLNLCLDITDTYANFGFEDDSDSAQTYETTDDLRVLWIPEGFELESTDISNFWTKYKYISSGHNYIYVIKDIGKNTVSSVDTEEAVLKNIKINDINALLILKNREVIITWGDTQKVAFITIITEGVNESEVIKIAENIQY